ncbi:lipopolysaccharide assembly protein LapB [Siphonobacter sp. SORGH_AS_1065]|uniref:tetratricopeptide repeat protein n=1 Tax=Siphonobacter sp. SORGH_AS_1065 TaxID=3041795 RepID=UPI002781A21B|nr:tetratricopeptide repeat protein [Siphonobacter sp. SORGH_AS_1065]MDQ1090040.1 tetratricopeptide (TPR) repeat protein [Siphonobacter sp. SORGH_AS_1065]
MLKDASDEISKQLYRAEILLDRKFWREALVIYHQLAQQETHLPEIFEGSMNAYFMADEFRNAWKVSLRWEQEFPQDSRVFFLRSILHTRKEEYWKAKDCVKKAIDLEVNQAEYYALYAELLITEKAYKRSWDVARQGLAMDAENISCLKAQISALRYLEYDFSEEAIQLLALCPEDAEVHTVLGTSYLYKGQIDKAREHYQKSLQINPESKEARDGLLESIKASNRLYEFLMNIRDGEVEEEVTQGITMAWTVICGAVLIVLISKYMPEKWKWLMFLSRVFSFILAFPMAFITLFILKIFLKPLSDSFLLISPYGRLCLETAEKRKAYLALVFCLLLIGYFVI